MHRVQPEAAPSLEPRIKTLSTSRLIAHVQAPLYRNAYAWMISTGISSGLGIIYWIVAARYYTTEVVGLSATMISAMIFLSGVSQLNLMSALIRFIPNAGQATSRLVGYSYAVTALIATVLGLLIVGGFRDWFSRFIFPDTSADLTLWFIVSTVIWCIFALQDSVLTGLRDAVWVPAENISYAVAKIALLVLFAKPLPQYGIFASWIIPVVVAILPINLLIFRRLVPRHVRMTKAQALPIVPTQIVKYIAGNYAGWLFMLASIRLLPVMVTHQAGARAGAYFFLSWMIANSLKLVTTNMAMSLTVEGVREPAKLKAQGSNFLINIAGIFVPMITVLLLGAPYILGLLGGSYSVEGTALLRLLALSVIPSIVTAIYTSVAQVRNRVASIVVVQGSFCVLVLTLSFALLRLYGITGVGFAFLASETIIALLLLLAQLRPFRQRVMRNSRSV